MRKIIKIVFISRLLISIKLFFFAALLVNAQDTLTIKQAVEIALKNNYSIGIAKNQSVIAKNNNTIGNAGYLPQITLKASSNSSNYNTNQEYSTGLLINQNDVKSTMTNYGVTLNWTLFDGLKMFATHDKLSELEAIGKLNLKIEIENILSKVMNTYYDIARQQQLIKAIQETIKIYEERLKIAQKKFETDSISKQDVLQAKVDLNAQKSKLLKQKALLNDTKITVNQLLSLPGDKIFFVKDSIPIKYNPKYEELKTSAMKQNNSLLTAQKNINANAYNIREFNSMLLPQINVNTAYNFSNYKSEIGFVLLNQNQGLNSGLTASWNLFNGFKTHTQIQNARLQLFSSKLQYHDLQAQVEGSLLRAWYNMQNSLESLKLEEENYIIAKENVTVALERFRTGNSSSLELMIAQKSFEEAQARLISERYNAKTVEIELMRLNGGLVK